MYFKEASVYFSNTDTVAGYLEYWYWLYYYCGDPDVEESAKAMSAENWA